MSSLSSVNFESVMVWQRANYPFEPNGGDIAKLHRLKCQREYEVANAFEMGLHSRPLSINRWL
jgi:hypothetical protein